MTLTFAYVGVLLAIWALISGWMFVVSQRPLLERILGAGVVLACAVGIWLNFITLLGYPVQQWPHKGQLAGMVDDRSGGWIYLWVRNNGEPRAFRVPYSDELAKDLIAAQMKLQQAGGGRIDINDLGEDGAGNGKAKQGRGRNDHGVSKLHGSDHGSHLHFIVIPALPPKD